MGSEKGFSRSLRFVMTLSAVMGMTFPRPMSQMRAKTIFAYRILVLSGIILLLINEIPTMIFWTSNSEGIHRMLAFIETRLRWLVIVLNFILSAFGNRKINNVIWILSSVPLNLDYAELKRITCFQVHVIVVTLLFLIPYMVLGMDVLWINPYYAWYSSSIYITTEFYLGFSNLQFVIMLFVLKKYFKTLNKVVQKADLESLPGKKKNDLIFVVKVKEYKNDQIAEIGKFRKIHMVLIDLCLKTNQCFSFQILFFLLVATVELTYAFRSIVTYVIHPNSSNVNFWRNKYWLEMSLTVFWSSYYFWHVMNIIIASESLTLEISKTKTVVDESINRVRNRDVEKQLRIFTLQLANQQVLLTAGKFVELSYPLFNSIIGTVVTYLIIITTFK